MMHDQRNIKFWASVFSADGIYVKQGLSLEAGSR
jgi:hypothetical protein